jgi:hypothetical protein
MTKPISNRSTDTQHVSDQPSASSIRNPIEPQSADNPKTKTSNTHHCITIKWSLDSASRRRFGLPPVAASGPASPAAAGGAAWL